MTKVVTCYPIPIAPLWGMRLRRGSLPVDMKIYHKGGRMHAKLFVIEDQAVHEEGNYTFVLVPAGTLIHLYGDVVYVTNLFIDDQMGLCHLLYEAAYDLDS